ncbi:thiamine biosynthesis protein ThiS [Brevibacillus fluminis]|uniref:Thiamine biosynthesis protein ThiS n=1 Tax=Brevibacillus fluminis TaxID=511487 RepID=A0A3M8DG74_9BACL|nr:sulfur carrier protein ThiS [Brevibacillus fluminis]RNB87102.1 thiamine biosynthesis protein ThiS [Brevibacillus fluminis]
MNLIINGKACEVPDRIGTIQHLLEHFHLDQKVVIVELNQTILDKATRAETSITDGDRIEIVHFVGGG